MKRRLDEGAEGRLTWSVDVVAVGFAGILDISPTRLSLHHMLLKDVASHGSASSIPCGLPQKPDMVVGGVIGQLLVDHG